MDYYRCEKCGELSFSPMTRNIYSNTSSSKVKLRT
jgi:uncharacterized OB-fold protein